MTTIILIIHLLLALAMCGVILLQRSEGGALGMGGGGGGGLMTARGTANLLTRVTAILATCFIATSMLLAILAARGSDRSIISIEPAPMQHQQEEPAAPSVPLAN